MACVHSGAEMVWLFSKFIHRKGFKLNGHVPICQYLWLFILVMPYSDKGQLKQAIQKAILSNTKYLAALIGILYVYILNIKITDTFDMN